MGLALPPSVRSSYLIHDGEESTHGALGHRLYPLAEVVEQCLTLRELDGDFDYDYWDGEAAIPLLAVGNGDVRYVEDAPDGEETPLLRWDHESSARETVAPSFRAYVDGVVAALQAGDYRYNRDLAILSCRPEEHIE